MTDASSDLTLDLLIRAETTGFAREYLPFKLSLVQSSSYNFAPYFTSGFEREVSLVCLKGSSQKFSTHQLP